MELFKDAGLDLEFVVLYSVQILCVSIWILCFKVDDIGSPEELRSWLVLIGSITTSTAHTLICMKCFWQNQITGFLVMIVIQESPFHSTGTTWYRSKSKIVINGSVKQAVQVEISTRQWREQENHGQHSYSRPILEVGIAEAFQEVAFEAAKFEKRGGSYE